MVGEVAGFVNLGVGGIGGIKINIFDAEEHLVQHVLSEADGYFSFMGLPTGEYVARVDETQLENLNLKINGDFPFSILNTREGDYVDNLEFFLSEAEENQTAGEELASEGQQQSQDLAEEEELVSEATVNTAALPQEEGEKEFSEVHLEEEKSIEEEASEETAEMVQEKVITQEKRLVYKVQFLTSINAIFEGDSRFKGIRHVKTEKTASGYRYLWGETMLPGEATALQNELRRSGFADTFVVHYYNGQRISVEEAVLIRSGKIILSNKVSERKQEKTKDLQPEAFKKQEGLRFRVQIAASKVPLDTTDVRVNGINGVEEYRHDKMYKYSVGNFSLFGEANQYKNVLRSQGLADAFVVPFHNDRRLEPQQKRGIVFFQDSNLMGIGGISLSVSNADGKLVSKLLSEADGSFVTPNLQPGTYSINLNAAEIKEIGMKPENERASFTISQEGSENEKLEFILTAMEETLNRSKAKDEGLIFKVQVLASAPKLSVDHRLLGGLENISRYRHKGLYKYTVGESDNLETIRKLQKEVRKSGFKDAFIVPFLNGVRINLQEMTGHVFVMSGDEKQGIEGMNIEIYQKGNHITSLTSNGEGRFSFLGLKPGVYTARIEKGQLQELQLKLKRSSNEFEIQRNSEGVIKQPVQFELERMENGDLQKESSKGDKIVYRIQLAASNVPLGPNHPTLKGIKDISMYRHNGMYKYTLGSTHSLNEARKLMTKLRETHKFSLFIVGFKEGKRILVVE
ncbi:MAG TPA: carboxypeptidase regulatory-like domain-containing protein [Salinimicrobium catena]|uniref:Carboxypeptidase regulatory-like domain-containing protein n=1 Tax=Salinimicrobium catena TaxID=390640 RepID=A0A7C2RDB7_9FLAO|nr:carboxypeptidase regulatory-like domain-containing protein [Salinimicrobium catena]